MAIFHFTLSQALAISEHYQYLKGRPAYKNPTISQDMGCIIEDVEAVNVGGENWNVQLFAKCTTNSQRIFIIPYLKEFGIDFEFQKFGYEP